MRSSSLPSRQLAVHARPRRVGPAADRLGMPGLDVRDDLIAADDLLEPSRGWKDQLGPAILGIGSALDVTEPFELVDDAPHDLLVTTGKPRQLGRAYAVLVQVGEHGTVTWMEVVVPIHCETLKELLLERVEQLTGQHSKVRVPLLSLAAALCG